MTLSRLRTGVVFVAVGLCALTGATSAQAATTYFATPTGAGVACTLASPCSANQALAISAADGDTVMLSGGDFNIAGSISVTKRISIEGALSGAPTRLIGNGVASPVLVYGGGLTALAAHVSDIQIIGSANNGTALYFLNQVSAPLTVDRVRVEQISNAATAIYGWQYAAGSGIVLRNTVARAVGANAKALELTGPTNGIASLDMRNVTADARGTGSFGMYFRGNGVLAISCGDLTLNMKNTYIRSSDIAANDIFAIVGSGNGVCPAKINSTNSNYRDKQLISGAVLNSTGDQHGDALFVDAAAGDYHQLAGSPTIDAGVVDSLIGSNDLDRLNRIQGPAPDIGAYEFPVAATPDTTAPVGSALKLSPSSFAPDSKTSSLARKRKKVKKGSTVSFNLTEEAVVTFTIERKVKGRKKGTKCSTARKKGKRCTTYKPLKGSFSRPSGTGANSSRFTGRLNGKKLKRGSYRLVGVPSDASTNNGVAFRGNFKIVKR